MEAKSIEDRLKTIELRNQKVEADKAWETSITRRLLVALVTYILISIIFLILKVETPFLNAIIPTVGFVLSTLSLGAVKKYWVDRYYLAGK